MFRFTGLLKDKGDRFKGAVSDIKVKTLFVIFGKFTPTFFRLLIKYQLREKFPSL